MSDPFVSLDGTINPLVTSTENNSYSVKVTTQKSSSGSPKVSVINGQLFGTSQIKVIGFQKILMEVVETIIKDLYYSNYSIGSLPSLGKPSGYILNPNDILISYDNSNDYFILRGTGVDRQIIFISLEQPDITFNPGVPEAPLNFFFSSMSSQNNYTVSYPEDNIFTITDQRGRILNYNFSTVPKATYMGVPLDEDNNFEDSTVTFKSNPFTQVGITFLPGVLPEDQSQINVAEGVSGIIYDENTKILSKDFTNYILSKSNKFTPTQKLSITNIIEASFLNFQKCVKHIINKPNRDFYSTNNGIAVFIDVENVKIDIRIS